MCCLNHPPAVRLTLFTEYISGPCPSKPAEVQACFLAYSQADQNRRKALFSRKSNS